jgi:Spy/CpxP family protein refolding chaperone
MKIKHSIITLIIVSGFVITPAAFAGKCGGNKMMGSDAAYCNYDNKMGRHCFSKDLSEEQIAKIQKQRDVFRNATKDLKNAILEKQYSLKSELTKKKPDAEKAKNIQNEISKIKAEIALLKIDHFIKIKEIDPYAKPMNEKGFHNKKQRGCDRKMSGKAQTVES